MQWHVPADQAGTRLDRFLSVTHPALSRARWQALIATGDVQVDGQRARPALCLRAGQEVRARIPEPSPARPQPEDLPLSVCHADAHLLVIDKPAGLVVHPGAGRSSGTLVNALLYHVRDLSGVGGVLRPGIVHRLDRGTSGLLVVAKDDSTHRALAQQFAAREVRKEYLAIVLGLPARASGRIDSPIGRDPQRRLAMAVNAPRARAARTDWRVEERLDGAALVRLHLHTGRTHQIRVHLAALGHPVAGDALYGGRRAALPQQVTARAALAALPRTALHSALLGFRHPATGAPCLFESALPADLVAVLDALRLVTPPR